MRYGCRHGVTTTTTTTTTASLSLCGRSSSNSGGVYVSRVAHWGLADSATLDYENTPTR